MDPVTTLVSSIVIYYLVQSIGQWLREKYIRQPTNAELLADAERGLASAQAHLARARQNGRYVESWEQQVEICRGLISAAKMRMR